MPVSDPLKLLADEGVSIWLDDLSRRRLASGDLERRVREEHVVGVTTNPTIFHNALGDELYAPELREYARLGLSAPEAVRLLTCRDVRKACDILAPVYESTRGQDGRVSIEVDPWSAHDADRSVAEAVMLWWLIDRPNVMIKIPATPAGLQAVSECLSRGISVNVTLIFSPDRYRQVLDSYLTGIEAALSKGLDISPIVSVASFFVSRIDTEVDGRLDALGPESPQDLRGCAAIANAALAYEIFEESENSDRWQRLVRKGANPQRLLWASTGVKDPAYDDTRYVIDLVAPRTVNTMPESTLAAVADHGTVDGDRITGEYRRARAVVERLGAAGVDIGEVVDKLEAEGVAKFQESWRSLILDVSSTLADYESKISGSTVGAP
ncbi:transaldolase [Nocardia sp. NPDC003963]